SCESKMSTSTPGTTRPTSPGCDSISRAVALAISPVSEDAYMDTMLLHKWVMAASSRIGLDTLPANQMVRRLDGCAPVFFAIRVSASSCSVEAIRKSMEKSSSMRMDWNGDSEKHSVLPVASAAQQFTNDQLDDRPGRFRRRVQSVWMNRTMRAPY